MDTIGILGSLYINTSLPAFLVVKSIAKIIYCNAAFTSSASAESTSFFQLL